MVKIITVVAPVNIAVIKYWGKRNEELILPLNDSLSGTLDTDVMCAKTSVCASPDFEEDQLWLNGKEECVTTDRIQNCFKELKARALHENSVNSGVLKWKIHICSVNNFPTAAGLASSAAGYACLVSALSKLYNIKSDISSIARLGSGSACRSIYGGFVQWHAGTKDDGSDSHATQIVDASHWPEMRVIILVVSDNKKKVSSTKGMLSSVETSELLKYRVSNCVPQRTTDIIKAIKAKDYEKFAEITMKDSNQFHSICMDTYPPCVYTTDVSLGIIDIIHRYNDAVGSTRVAYTFDAGPNACLYLLEKDVAPILSIIKKIYPSDTNPFIIGMTPPSDCDTSDLLKKMNVNIQEKNVIKYAIYTKIGDGPEELNDSHLLDDAGNPLI